MKFKRILGLLLSATMITMGNSVVFADTDNNLSGAEGGELSAYDTSGVSSTDVAYAVEGGNIYIDTSIGAVTGADRNVTSVVIPESVDGVKVTSIGNSAFYGCRSLTNVTIPDSVTIIDAYAFYCCSSLTSVTIPDAVTSIMQYTFYGCSSLADITIPNSVTRTDIAAFAGTPWYDNNTDEFMIVGDRVLIKYEGSGSSVTIPNSVKNIGGGVFRNHDELTSITIPNSVTSIGDSVFDSCIGLTSIIIPDSVTSIGDGVFVNCISLTSITIPNSVTSIGVMAFCGCSSLTSIIIPDSITKIYALTFVSCKSLKSITIPNSVTIIDYGAFWGCSALTSVTIPESVAEIDITAFEKCTALTTVYCYKGSTADNTELYPEGVRLVYLGESSIKPTTQTTTETTTEDTTETTTIKLIDGQCGENVSYTYGNGSLSIEGDGKMYDASADDSYFGEYKNELEKVSVGDNVTSIGNYTFKDCTALNEVQLSTGVEEIGEGAFSGCTSLKELIIPDTVTSIRVHAFADLPSNAVIYNYSKTEINEVQLGENSSVKVVYIDFEYGEINADRTITSSDAANLLQKALDSTYELPIERYTKDYMKYCDVSGDGIITASDAAEVLQKVLDTSYVFSAEK